MRSGGAHRRFVVAATTALLVLAMLPIDSASAARLPGSVVITVSEPGGLSPETEAAVESVAARHGAHSLMIHRGTLQLSRITRGDVVVQEPPPGFLIPMSSAAVDPTSAAPLIGGHVAEVLEAGKLVFGETSAALRGARVGDTVAFYGWDGNLQKIEVGAIAPDARVWWTEMLFSTDTAASFGFVRGSSVSVWGFAAQDLIVMDLWSELPDVRLSLSSPDDPQDPDNVLPTVLVKQRFGEFAYRPTGNDDRVIIDPAWQDENIVWVDLPLLGPFRCHRAVVPYLRSAIGEVIDWGLSGHISRSDFQIAGGCYNPRLIRGGDKGGAVSRHTWGIAIDINPNDNPYGGRIGMDVRVAAIFQRWGFAWGGGWTYPDGGHFEWNHVPEHLLRA